jgi:hypothetical protein
MSSAFCRQKYEDELLDKNCAETQIVPRTLLEIM